MTPPPPMVAPPLQSYVYSLLFVQSLFVQFLICTVSYLYSLLFVQSPICTVSYLYSILFVNSPYTLLFVRSPYSLLFVQATMYSTRSLFPPTNR